MNGRAIIKKILSFVGTKPKYENKFVCFNWKMNPETLDDAVRIAKQSDHDNVIVFPPLVFIEEVGQFLNYAKLGVQDIFYKNIEKGPYTGEVSPKELINLGVEYAIIGHSERRAMGETDQEIAQKIKTAIDNDITPILCVGENIEQKNNNSTKELLKNQILGGLSLINETDKEILIAYEPIWAIGTGTPDTPENALETIKYIREVTDRKYPVLYGGSVTHKNINSFLRHKEIGGVLVGGASLDPKSFF